MTQPARFAQLSSICVLAMLIAAPVAAGHDYCVAPTGDDKSAGTATAPWKTLQRAAASVAAGDTVIIRAGTYAGFILGYDSPQSGSAFAPIHFKAEPGAVVTSRNNKTPDGINLE